MTPTKVRTKQSGFVALMSVVIMSAVLLLIATTFSHTAFYTRLNILDSELKEKSSALAWACIEKARLALALDSTFIGTSAVNVGTNTCDYQILSGGAIISHGSASATHTYYRVIVDNNTESVSIVSFEELSTFP